MSFDACTQGVAHMALMPITTPDTASFEEYRQYLATLGRISLNSKLRGKLDLSGVVQQTLWEAHNTAERPSRNQDFASAAAV